MNCRALFSQERSSAKFRQVSRETVERAHAGAAQVRIQGANRVIGDHVERTRHREGRDRRAARQRLELNDAESVGEAREYKDIRRCDMRGQILPGFFAEEFRSGIAMLQHRLLRTVADHDLGAGQIQRQKRLEIFFDRDTADRHEDGSRQSKFGSVAGPEQVGVDPARPGAELAKSARAEFLLQRSGGDHRHRGGRMKVPQHRIAHSRRQHGAHLDIFREARRIGGRERKLAAAAIGAHRPSDRSFGRDMDRVRRCRLDPGRDLAPVRPRHPQPRIGRDPQRRKPVRSQKIDLRPERGSAAGQRGQRANHAVDLRVPSVGRNQNPHHGNLSSG